MPLRKPAPPSPPRIPLLGHTLRFARDPLGFITDTARSVGPIAKIDFAGLPFYLLSDPEDIDRVLVREAKRFAKDYITRKLDDVLGHGLLTSEGELWRRQRKLSQPAFQPRSVDAYVPAMVRLAESLASRLREGERRDLHADMMSITLDIVAETLFGTVVRDDAATIAHALDVFQRRYEGVLGSGLILDERIPIPIHLQMRRASAALDRMLYAIIEARRSETSARHDLLGTYLASQDEGGLGMSDEQLRDEAITLILAGHETTALTLTYAFRLLTEHPEQEASLHEELDRVLGDRAPTRADADALPFTEAVVKESLRLYPPAWMIGREATEPVELRGYVIEKGETVLLPQWVVHRDPVLYRDPESFRPERWLNGETKGLPRSAFFPFGNGPRVCIGNQFAMLEAVLVLAAIARQVRVHVDLDVPLAFAPSITLRPKGPVRARITRRAHRETSMLDAGQAG